MYECNYLLSKITTNYISYNIHNTEYFINKTPFNYETLK